jgi:hypothetical protein
MSKLTLKEANVLVHNVNPDACEAFLRKYPKIRTVMTSIARKNKDLRKGYAAFLKFKDKQEGYLGGRAEVTTSPTFGEKVFYKYDWMGTKGWAEVYQYIDGIKSEDINKQNIKESALSSILISVVALLGGAAVKTFGEYFFRSVISGARAVYGDIKNIVAPESYIKFLKKLENNDKFNKEFIKFTIDNKKNNILHGKNWIDGVTELPSFVSAFKTFATEENFSDVDKNEVLDAIKTSMEIAYRTKADVIYKKLKQKYPEISSELTDGLMREYTSTDITKSNLYTESVDGVKVHTIDEASLSRVYQHVSGHPKVKSWGMMSGYRNANTKEQNRATNQQLEKDLRAMNLGFFKVEGHWKECQDSSVSWQDCPKDQLKDSVEESFFIPNISNEQLLGLTKKYNQDSAVYGDKENPGEAFLLFKNGSTENIGKFNANKVATAYSQMKGDKSFLFSKPESEPETDTKLKSVLKKTIKNPKTGRDIKIQSALQYDTNHPVYKLAQRMMQQKN